MCEIACSGLLNRFRRLAIMGIAQHFWRLLRSLGRLQAVLRRNRRRIANP
jgi:hypothetical protein